PLLARGEAAQHRRRSRLAPRVHGRELGNYRGELSRASAGAITHCVARRERAGLKFANAAAERRAQQIDARIVMPIERALADADGNGHVFDTHQLTTFAKSLQRRLQNFLVAYTWNRFADVFCSHGIVTAGSESDPASISLRQRGRLMRADDRTGGR